MRFLYSLGIRGYALSILFLSLFNQKARKWIEGRKNWKTRLSEAGIQGALWVHCASLGEFEQGRPIIEALRKRYPGEKILLTFFSPSGYEIRKNYDRVDYVSYLPLDTISNASNFLKIVQPKFAVFIKYEIWHNFYFQLRKNRIPHFLVSAIFRENQIYFKPAGRWFKKTLLGVSKIFTQDEKSSKLLSQAGINSSIVAGDTRFDRVWEISRNRIQLEKAEYFSKGSMTIVAGSTWPDDERFLKTLLEKNKDLKLILAPHEVGLNRILSIQKNFENSSVWSSDESNIKDLQVLIIDQIGLLSSLYQYADIAYIGGGFGSGIHNILEPACFGKPIIFGPKYQKFKEAKELINLAGAFSFSKQNELQAIIGSLSTNSELRERAGKTCAGYVSDNRGATKEILGKLSSLL